MTSNVQEHYFSIFAQPADWSFAPDWPGQGIIRDVEDVYIFYFPLMFGYLSVIFIRGGGGHNIDMFKFHLAKKLILFSWLLGFQKYQKKNL